MADLEDDDQPPAAQAAQACMMCKTRKKKCDKLLPSCGYCITLDAQVILVVFGILISGVGKSLTAFLLSPQAHGVMLAFMSKILMLYRASVRDRR
jgi:hypothetical protein